MVYSYDIWKKIFTLSSSVDVVRNLNGYFKSVRFSACKAMQYFSAWLNWIKTDQVFWEPFMAEIESCYSEGPGKCPSFTSLTERDLSTFGTPPNPSL